MAGQLVADSSDLPHAFPAANQFFSFGRQGQGFLGLAAGQTIFNFLCYAADCAVFASMHCRFTKQTSYLVTGAARAFRSQIINTEQYFKYQITIITLIVI